ncbi:helix-turn-helix domain-containing protein (plasmid) [Haloferax prahovense]|uniref:helix-turn-helix domain-containing protein n=1 Tax=Haloferax TaxID=2251 RepID=UPI000737B5B9|nr:helix-turn-helix domain-containing protein [Haloferax sp. Q22]
MYKAVFHIDGDSPYSQSTKGTDTEIRLWCNDHCDLLYVSGERQEDVIAQVSSEVGVDERLTDDDGDGQVVVTEACLEEGAGNYIKPYLVANNCLLLPPWQYRDGMKVVRVLALDPANLSSFYRDISSDYTVVVESKQELAKAESGTPIFSMESYLPTLTDRQREVFLTAHDCGYYEIPRNTTTTEIADTIGVGRRTVEHHLRRAEEKLTDVLVDHI